jgi:hypothetical protein
MADRIASRHHPKVKLIKPATAEMIEQLRLMLPPELRHLGSLPEGPVANLLGYQVSTLRAWRRTGKGPPFTRRGFNVRYPLPGIALYMFSDEPLDPPRKKRRPPPKRSPEPEHSEPDDASDQGETAPAPEAAQ